MEDKAKEKAIELYSKMEAGIGNINLETEEWYTYAKNCAIISVEETIKAFKELRCIPVFWIRVKKEIEKL